MYKSATASQSTVIVSVNGALRTGIGADDYESASKLVTVVETQTWYRLLLPHGTFRVIQTGQLSSLGRRQYLFGSIYSRARVCLHQHCVRRRRDAGDVRLVL